MPRHPATSAAHRCRHRPDGVRLERFVDARRTHRVGVRAVHGRVHDGGDRLAQRRAVRGPRRQPPRHRLHGAAVHDVSGVQPLSRRRRDRPGSLRWLPSRDRPRRPGTAGHPHVVRPAVRDLRSALQDGLRRRHHRVPGAVRLRRDLRDEHRPAQRPSRSGELPRDDLLRARRVLVRAHARRGGPSRRRRHAPRVHGRQQRLLERAAGTVGRRASRPRDGLSTRSSTTPTRTRTARRTSGARRVPACPGGPSNR